MHLSDVSQSVSDVLSAVSSREPYKEAWASDFEYVFSRNLQKKVSRGFVSDTKLLD